MKIVFWKSYFENNLQTAKKMFKIFPASRIKHTCKDDATRMTILLYNGVDQTMKFCTDWSAPFVLALKTKKYKNSYDRAQIKETSPKDKPLEAQW